MAELRHAESGGVFVLEAEHVVGRSPRSELRIDRNDVSTRHALLRFNGSAWEVRDLGSRNGTFLDGVRLNAAEDHLLKRGAVLRFGLGQDEWMLEDDAPPEVMVVRVDGSGAVKAEGSILALPSVDEPEVTLYRGPTGSWLIEKPDARVTSLADHDVFEAAGQTWRFCCPLVVAATQSVGQPLSLREIELRFGVSSDEEHVEIRAHSAGQELDLGSRTHNYLLLTLARTRLEEVRGGVPDEVAGWVYQDELLRDLDTDQPQLNVDVFRLRRQFVDAGFVDGASVIERRSSTKQLRIGISRLRIDRA